MTEMPYFTTLPGRGLVKITGPDARAFLQGLISNNIELLNTQPCIYACLLTPQGKFLHDFFITEKDGMLLLDCEGGPRTEDLARHLSMYKLRSKVEITSEKEIPVYAVFGAEHGTPDPRHPEMGYRSYEKPDLPEKPFESWDRHRILLTIPDGSRDMIPEKSTLLESNIDKLNGISFEKGCYMGQELTARMNYRGLGKKHFYTVYKNIEPPGTLIHTGEEIIGEMRSSCADVGIALLKDEKAKLITQPDRGKE